MCAIGQINYLWANLDAVVSAAIVATMGIDPVEISIILGKLDTRAKVVKLQKIFEHRKDHSKATFLRKLTKQLDERKAFRNAMTHGFYMGHSDDGQHIWALPSSALVTANFSGSEMFVATEDEMVEHSQSIATALSDTLDFFDPASLRALFDLPARTQKGLR